MPEKEMVIDHRSLFRLFHVALVGYALLWAVRYAGWYLFGYWGSMSSDDPMSMLLIFWVPVLLFLIILVTLLFALFGGYGMKASPRSLLLHTGILLAITFYIWWAVTRPLMMGLT
ncbi:MAG TPA: hypothetical protein HA343_06580 [Methanomassiliicoccales archaeon]|nr:hypothetical protein [Methanomassiliicoccales archaeon]